MQVNDGATVVEQRCAKRKIERMVEGHFTMEKYHVQLYNEAGMRQVAE
jgi:hypothetical protein